VLPELDDTREALNKCTRQLRGRARQLVELHYVRELRPTRIAQQLGMSANAVFVALHRVRTALRKCVEARLAATGGQAR
jgi:RNA polymerase sigma-70 factor (ECF subfamily)